MEFLFVYPNPYAAFDKDGHPCGVCPRDPDADAGGPGQFVGARVDKDKTEILQDFGKMAAHELRSPMQRTKYSYLGIASDDPELPGKLASKEPVRLPRTKFYRERLIEGSLLAADAATARSANVIRFVDPKAFFRRFEAALLPDTPGLIPLPTSPDAEGNVLTAPALSEGETRTEIAAEPTTSRRKAAQ